MTADKLIAEFVENQKCYIFIYAKGVYCNW